MTHRNRRGAYLIEFALVLPVVLAGLGGVVEYGRYLERQMTVVSVMRDAARTGSTQLPILGAPPAVAARETAYEGLAEQGLAGEVTATVEGVAPDKVRESYEQALEAAREAGLEDAVRPLVEIRLADLDARESA